MKKSDEIKEFYEKFTKTLIRDRIYPNPRHQKIKSHMKEIFNRYKFKNALEIGCGIGMLSELISKYVPSVTGLDISEENIKFAKATVSKVNFLSSDFFEISTNTKYDFITLFDVLEHFPKEKHDKVFRKIAELSNPQTIIAITIPDPHFLFYIREHHPEKLQVVDESIFIDDLLLIFMNYNLEVLKFDKYGIDYDNQYNFYLLGFKKNPYELEKLFFAKQNVVKSIFIKISNRISRVTGKLKYSRYLKQ